MNKRNKKIFEYVSDHNPQYEFFGHELQSLITPKDSLALYIVPSKKKCYILTPKGRHLNEISILVELISYLEYAEATHCLYINHVTELKDNYVLYANCSNLQQLGDGCSYKIGTDAILKWTDKERYIKEKGEIVLSVVVDISYLYEDVIYYLFGQIYAAHGLRKFIEHEFLSDQDYYANKSLCVARGSLWVAIAAIIVSVILPFFSKDEYVYLADEQFVFIKDSLRITEVVQLHDTIYLEKHDTIYKIERNTNPNNKKIQ